MSSATLKTILDTKIIAISRALYGSDLAEASLALYKGGVRAFEAAIVQTEPLDISLECIRLLKSCLPCDAVVGAGTVLNADQVIAAHESGASFVISPNTDERVIAETKRLGMVSIPGALTPTEILHAYDCGADIVKVFPAGTMGVEYFKQIKAPLAYVPLAAVGGISYANAQEFNRAGAAAFGISGSLYKRTAVEQGDFDSVTKAALDYYSLIR